MITDFLPFYPKTQPVGIVGSTLTYLNEQDISDYSCLIDALSYEKISNSVFQVGTIMAYDRNLERWETFYNFHVWGIDLIKKQLIDFAISRLPSVSQELNFDFVVKPEQMQYTIIPYHERQKAWNCLGGKGDGQPNYFGDAHLVYVPGALPSTIAVPPSPQILILLTITEINGYIEHLNQTVDLIQQLEPQGAVSHIFSVMTFQ